MLSWVDAGLLRTLLPLSQWIHNPAQKQTKSQDVQEKSWEDEVELVLRLLANITYNPTHRLRFRDGADIPDLLSLLKPTPYNTTWDHIGLFENAAEVVANIAMDKDIQIMIIVEDGVTFMAQMLLLLPNKFEALARVLVRAIHNLSYDPEVQAILAAKHTFPYFLNQIRALAGKNQPIVPLDALDLNASHTVEFMAVSIVHDISCTIQWLDTLVENSGHVALMQALTHPSCSTWESSSLDIATLLIKTLSNLCQTAYAQQLVVDGIVNHLVKLTLLYLNLPQPSERDTLQYGYLLFGLSTLVNDTSACSQLAAQDKYLQGLALWITISENASLDFLTNAVTLLAKVCSFDTAVHAIASKASPKLLCSIANLAMIQKISESGSSACLVVLSSLVGPELDMITQGSWEYGFVPNLVASEVLHHALCADDRQKAFCLQLLLGCLRQTKYDVVNNYRLPTSVVLHVITCFHYFPTTTKEFNDALSILEFLIQSQPTRRQLCETQALDAFVLGLLEAPQSLLLPAAQELFRKLFLEAMEVFCERNSAIVHLLINNVAQANNPLLVDTTLSFLGHLVLNRGEISIEVITEMQKESRLLHLLARHVEQVHATTCSRASVNVHRSVSYEDMLRVYLFSLTFGTQNNEKPLTPGSNWIMNKEITSCFIMDVLFWYSNDQHKDTPHFTTMYPNVLLCTSRLVEIVYPETKASQISGFYEPIQEDIIKEMLLIITHAPAGAEISQACLTALVLINAWWFTDTLVITMLLRMPEKSTLMNNLVTLLVSATHDTLRFLMLMVTTDSLVEDLKQIGVKQVLEAIEITLDEDKVMVSALLNLLGYSVDLSLEFVDNLEAFSDSINNPVARQELMAKLKATLAMNVVNDEKIVAAILPRLVFELTRDVAFLNDIVQCLAALLSLECFATYCTDASTVLRVYIEHFHSLTTHGQDTMMEILMSLHDAGVTPEMFGFYQDAYHPLEQLLILATSVQGANMVAKSKMLHFTRLNAMQDGHLSIVLARNAYLLTPLCPILYHLPPQPQKKSKLCMTWTPEQSAQIDLVQLLQSIAELTWSPETLENASSLFEAIVGCLCSYEFNTAAKLQALQFSYLEQLANIVLRLASFLTEDAFMLDNGLKLLVHHLETKPTSPPVQLNMYKLVASLSKISATVLAFNRLQCLETLVNRFPKLHKDYQLYVLAALADAARTGLESEIVSRMAVENGAIQGLLRGIQTYTRQPQEHAAFLLSALLLRYPDLGGFTDCVTILIESLEAVDIVVVQHVLVCLSAILHVEPTQETLLRNATVPVLAQILQKGDYVCTEHVLRILAILCSKHAAVCRRVVAANLLGILLTSIRNVHEVESRPHDVFHAAWILSCIAKDKDLSTRIEENDENILEFVVQNMENFAIQTLNKFLRMLGYVWGYAEPTLHNFHLVSPVVKQLLRILSLVEEAKLQKNAMHLLSILFLHPQLEVEPEVLAAVTQCFFTHLHSKIEKLVVFAINAMKNGLCNDGLTDHLVRAHFDVHANVLEVLRLIVPEAYHPVQNKLLGALQFLNGIVTEDSSIVTLTPLATPALSMLRRSKSTLTRQKSSALTLTPLMVAALKQLILLLQEDSIYYTDALHILVNFSTVADLTQSIVLHGGLHFLLESFLSSDETHLPLVLLGIASLSDDALAKQTIDFTTIVPKIMKLIVSSHATIQATCVWIISNISTIDSIRRLINAQNGASVLQALLHEVTNPTLLAATSRPVSSSKRIRDHAPKALKDLGYNPVNPR
ncbi:hypothetical protein THRCLA_08838 [Thraustotheca clavata]|uniref:Vacuolar protein 8 n=1 Tax=Thraustotheca clavata TaxID=74557 RepID=A0A1V9Z1V7_9STRA|nr:hypothetical protein THRCLA_08838 [Thraustotheca clavata]